MQNKNLNFSSTFCVAVDASRQQLQTFRSNQGTRPILEEFIPIKHPNSQESTEKASNISDKASWMTSAQLWSQASEGTKPKSTITSPKKSADTGFSVSPRLALDSKRRNGGAFLPFSKERNACQGMGDLPELGLASSESEMEVKKCEETEKCSKRENSGKGGSFEGIVDQGKIAAIATEAQTTNTTTTTTGRKARRCWSPDLHRRFVNALQMLGGSQGIIS